MIIRSHVCIVHIRVLIGTHICAHSRMLAHSLGRGGQSAVRFARLREEKRHNYVRKVAETAVTLFIDNEKVPHSPLHRRHPARTTVC